MIGGFFKKKRIYAEFQKAMRESMRGGRVNTVPVLIAGNFPDSGLAKGIAEALGGMSHFTVARAPAFPMAPSGRPVKEAAALLQATSGSLLIWGEREKAGDMTRLGFVSRATAMTMDYWPLTEHSFPQRLTPAYAEALKALVLAALEPALSRDRNILVSPLEGALTRLDIMLNRPPEEAEGRMPVAEEDRPHLLHAYAQGAIALSQFKEDEEVLPMAVRAAGGAAAGYDALKNPAAAGDARMLTGIALQRFGVGKKDPEYLHQAVDAYRYALQPGPDIRGADAIMRTRIRLSEVWLELIGMDKAKPDDQKHAQQAAKSVLSHCERVQKQHGAGESPYYRAAQGVMKRLWMQREKGGKAGDQGRKSSGESQSMPV